MNNANTDVPRSLRETLNPGEGVILILHPSAWGYAWHFLLGFLLLAAGVFIPITEGRIIAILAGAFYLGYTEIRRRRTTYYLTDLRIVRERRVISRTSSTVPYHQITDLHLEQSLFGRLVNTGTLSINTAGKDGFEMVMEKISRPYKVKNLIESRMMERGHSPS
ncbi:MAG: PH domain-containing protein [Methanolinea sp.]|nr:PH domain-containing protein [Methanolinea sp.]